MTDLNDLDFRRSSRCNATNNCVEVAHRPGVGVAIRDSKNGPTGPVLQFTTREWDDFLDGAKNGEFDVEQSRASAATPPARTRTLLRSAARNWRRWACS
nr:DUF397 domain-containing protein [Kribbella catacumbae]